MLRVGLVLLPVALATVQHHAKIDCSSMPQFCSACKKFEYCLTAPDDACDDAPTKCQSCVAFAGCDVRAATTKEDILARSELRSTYSSLLKMAAKVDVTRRQAAKFIAKPRRHKTRAEKRLLKMDPEMITLEAEKLADQARVAAGKQPISLASHSHGKGPMDAYRQASSELVDAAHAVNFLRRKGKPELITHFVRNLKDNEGEGEETEVEELEEEVEEADKDLEEAKEEEEKLEEEVEEAKGDAEEAEEEVVGAQANVTEAANEVDASDEAVEDAKEDKDFTGEVSDDLATSWSMEMEPEAAHWHADAREAGDKLEEAEEDHAEDKEDHEEAQEDLAEAQEEQEQAEEEHEETKEDLEHHQEEVVEEAEEKAEDAESALKDAQAEEAEE